MKAMRKIPLLRVLSEAIFPGGCVCCGGDIDIEAAARDPIYLLCADCRARWRDELHPQVDKDTEVLTLAEYDPAKASVGKRIVLKMKDDDRYVLSAFAARELCVAISAFWPELPDDAVICFAPRRKETVRRTGFDHMRYVAKELAQQMDLSVLAAFENGGEADQKSKNAAERKQNVKENLRLKRSAAQKLAGRTVVLLDDVVTTGATLSVCRALAEEAGAARVICAAMLKTAAKSNKKDL